MMRKSSINYGIGWLTWLDLILWTYWRCPSSSLLFPPLQQSFPYRNSAVGLEKSRRFHFACPRMHCSHHRCVKCYPNSRIFLLPLTQFQSATGGAHVCNLNSVDPATNELLHLGLCDQWSQLIVQHSPVHGFDGFRRIPLKVLVPSSFMLLSSFWVLPPGLFPCLTLVRPLLHLCLLQVAT